MLTITHTHEAGTLIEGTSKGDGTADILKRQGWRWGRSITSWYVPQSRDRLPKTWVISRTAEALREAGFLVEVEIDDTHRPTEEVEAGRRERQAERVSALTEKAQRREAAAEAADARLQDRLGSLPPMGEPIKVGHHSEGRHRAAIRRADAAFGASVEARSAAEAAAERVRIAARTTDSRYSPRTVARRIERLSTEARGLRRKLEGYSHTFAGGYVETYQPASGEYRERLTARLAEVEDQLSYWSSVRADQIEAGQAGDYSPQTISKGDRVLYMCEWCEVTRVNPKSVSVLMRTFSHFDGSPRKTTVPYGDIAGHKPAVSD